MTANQIVLCLMALAIVGVLVCAFRVKRRVQKRQPIQTHQPHRPGARNDTAAVTQSQQVTMDNSSL